MTITIEDFLKVDIRVGTILEAVPNEGCPQARLPPAGGFRPELGRKRSSAQLVANYRAGGAGRPAGRRRGQLPAAADRQNPVRGAGAGLSRRCRRGGAGGRRAAGPERRPALLSERELRRAGEAALAAEHPRLDPIRPGGQPCGGARLPAARVARGASCSRSNPVCAHLARRPARRSRSPAGRPRAGRRRGRSRPGPARRWRGRGAPAVPATIASRSGTWSVSPTTAIGTST